MPVNGRVPGDTIAGHPPFTGEGFGHIKN